MLFSGYFSDVVLSWEFRNQYPVVFTHGCQSSGLGTTNELKL
jgi:hypothetical protein